MAFEHYTRSGTKMLRCGYTTGTCAALAAAAAVRILLTGNAPETVSLMTGKGIPVEVIVTEYGASEARPEKRTAWTAIPKDAGDDADVTEGMLIRADVTASNAPGIHIDGGSGVGRSDTALHKDVSGSVKWEKGVQINRPNEKAIRSWLEEVLD